MNYIGFDEISDDDSIISLDQQTPSGNKHINMQEYSAAVRKMRRFFEEKGWYEVHTQSRLSILATCENPNTISTYNFAGEVWPLPQTGQMWLEHELLSNPDVPGVFCLSTSYINEPISEELSDKILPMFEFEMRGTMEDLIGLEVELLEYLGFGGQESFAHKAYRELATEYGVEELDYGHEERMYDENGSVVFLENFPNHISPFWNMKNNTETENAHKVDVILHGMETICSAERSTNKEEMREQFYKISGGNYAKFLFSNFTKERVVKELEHFLMYDMVDRCGGGIGVTKMIRAMKMSNILYAVEKVVVEADAEAEAKAEAEADAELISPSKKSKSRCWRLPVAAKKHSAVISSVLVGAVSAGGEKAIELAVNMI